MKTKYNFDTTVTHKDVTYTIRNNRLYDGKTRITFIDNAVLSNKIIRSYMDTIKNAKYGFSLTDSFGQLVITLTYLMSALGLLMDMKSWSTGKTRWGFYRSKGKSTIEKFTEECHSLIKKKLYKKHQYQDKIWYDRKFSKSQEVVLHKLSSGFVGHEIHDWDFNEAYDAKKRSTAKVKKLLADVKKFNFGKYGVKKKPIVDECKRMCENTLKMAENFKRLMGST
jgi:hypothetical protein